MQTRLYLRERFRFTSLILVVTTLVMACLFILGWFVRHRTFSQAVSGNAYLNPVTASTLIVVCISFILIFQKKINNLITNVLLGSVAALAIWKLVQFGEMVNVSENAIVINPIASANLLLLSIGMMTFSWRPQFLQLFASFGFLTSLFTLLAFLYEVPELETYSQLFPLSVFGAICFMMLSTACLLATAKHGWVRHLALSMKESTAGIQLIVSGIFIPVVVGYIRMFGEWNHWVSTELGVMCLVFAVIVMFAYAAWMHIREVNTGRDKRMRLLTSLKEAHQESVLLNEELRATNEELKSSNHQLSVLNASLREANGMILQQRDEQLNRALEATNDVIWSRDLTGKGSSYVSRSAERIFQRSTEYLIKNHGFWFEGIHPDDISAITKLYSDLNAHNAADCYFRLLDQDGSIRWMHSRPRLIKDDNGHAIREVGIVSDVTSLFKAKEELQKYRENLDIVFNNTEEGILLADRHGKSLVYNRTFGNFIQRVSGKKIDTGMFVWDMTTPERKEISKKLFEQVLSGRPVTSEAHFRTPDGVVIQSLRYAPIFIGDEISHVCLVSTDITAQRKDQLKLKQSETNLRAIFENTTGAFTLLDNDLNVVAFNEMNARLVKDHTGLELKIGESVYTTLPEQRHHAFSQLIERASHGKVIRHQVKYEKESGERWFDVAITPVLDNDSHLNGYCISSHDVTAQKKAEAEILRLNNSLLDFQNAIHRSSIVSMADPQGNITFVNDNFVAISGYERNELLGKNHHIVSSHHHPKSFWINMWRTISSGNVWRERVKNKRKNGTFYWVDTFVMPFVDGDGKILQYLSIRNDITSTKNSEDQLLQERVILEEVNKVARVSYWVQGNVFEETFFSRELPGMFEVRPDFAPRTIDQLLKNVFPDDIAGVRSLFIDGNNTLKKEVEFRVLSASGAIRWLYGKVEGGKFINEEKRCIGILQDITDRVNAIAEIEKLSLVASKTKNTVMVTDQHGQIEWVNESFVRSTGYGADEVVGNMWDFLNGLDSDQNTVVRIREKMERHEQISEELAKYRKDGSLFWVRLDITPVFDEKRAIKNFIFIQSDISELKEFERSIVGIARDLSSLIENANVPIFGIDRGGNIVEWNKVASEITGMSRSRVSSVHWKSVFAASVENGAFRNAISQAFEGIATSNIEFPISTPDGKKVMLLLSASPRRSSANEISGIIFVGQNITELTEYKNNLERKVEERTRELHDALATERELVKMKSQFVSIASHEFRTPLTTISIAAGFIRKFKARLSPEAVDEKLLNVEKQVTYMTHLLDDVLMVGKAEAGKIPVNKKDLLIKSFIQQLAEEVAKTTGNTHQVILDLATSAPDVIHSDEKLLRNIFINLLTNAIKFSPDADIVKLKMTADSNILKVLIADRGIGIPESDVKNLFQPFYRGGNVEAIQGTGLGLSIIKKAVDLLNGAVSVKSQTGRGTEVTVEIPIA